MNAEPLTTREMIEKIMEIRAMIRHQGGAVRALPIRNVRTTGRYFKRVKGRKSASLRERSRRRKVTR